MKKSGLLAASVVAVASATAVSVSSSTQVSLQQDGGDQRGHGGSSLTSKEKFVPRFDGLRFIETLITAHR